MTTTTRVCPFCRADLRPHCPSSPSCPWWKCRICEIGPIDFNNLRALKATPHPSGGHTIEHVDWPHIQPDIHPGEE